MTIGQQIAKHLAEVQDLRDMQENEVQAMLKRHEYERLQQPAAYFEQRRERQLGQLKARHLIERDYLSEFHDKEYLELSNVRSILHNAEQDDAQEKAKLREQMRERNAEEKQQEEKTILERIRELVQFKLKTKNKQQEM